MLKHPFLLFLIAAAILVPALLARTGQAQPDAAATTISSGPEQPVLAVMFYSNWCGSCQILDPRIEAIKPEFADRAVDFVKFDFSFALVRGKALQDLANEKDIPNIYAQNKGRTGFMLIIDPETEGVLEIITIRDSKEAIAAKLERAMHRPVAQATARAG